MAKQLKTYTLTDYSNNTWTDIVSEAADLLTIIVCNTSNTIAVTVRVRIGLSEISGEKVINAGEAVPMRIGEIATTNTIRLQVMASAPGMHFTVSGKVDAE